MKLALFNDSTPAETARFAERFAATACWSACGRSYARARERGTAALSASDDPLVSIGMEADAHGRVTRNCYGVFVTGVAGGGTSRMGRAGGRGGRRGSRPDPFDARRAASIPDLGRNGRVGRRQDDVPHRRLVARRATFYALDSTDPAKLKAILDDIERRVAAPASRGTAVHPCRRDGARDDVVRAVVNLDKLSALYDQLAIDSRAELSVSHAAWFAPRSIRRAARLSPRGAPDGRRSHDGRASQRPADARFAVSPGLAGVDLRRWLRGTDLDRPEMQRHGASRHFCTRNGVARTRQGDAAAAEAWSGAALWTKQDFEESLGKSEALGHQDRHRRTSAVARTTGRRRIRSRIAYFWRFGMRPWTSPAAIETLRRAGYPVAVVDIPARTPLSRYMQFVHYVVFGIAYLRDMNFVTQPSVELYKSIASDIYAESKRAEARSTRPAWRSMIESAAAGRRGAGG